MIYSMTGYGKAASENKTFSVEVEVKSVNGRYLDIYLKFPSILANKEYDLREVIKTKISRGKLTAIISVKKNGKNEELSSLNKEKLKSYLQLLKDLKKAAKINEKIKLEHLLQTKEIFSEEEFTINDSEFTLIKKTLSSALDNLLKMKKK